VNIKEEIARLEALGADRLAWQIVNDQLNDLVARYADYDEDEDDPHGHGKRVPYIWTRSREQREVTHPTKGVKLRP
jgi:hypothetical protein